MADFSQEGFLQSVGRVNNKRMFQMELDDPLHPILSGYTVGLIEAKICHYNFFFYRSFFECIVDPPFKDSTDSGLSYKNNTCRLNNYISNTDLVQYTHLGHMYSLIFFTTLLFVLD